MTDERDPERDESVLDRVDGRHYGDDVEGEDYSDLTGEAPLCEWCGERQAVERGGPRDLCEECVDVADDGGQA